VSIKLDVSTTSVVVTCSECTGVWWAFAWDKGAAHDSGAAHLVIVHGWEPARAGESGRQYREYQARKAAQAPHS
jgi:hypothetical protein